ncbi:NUMOD4 domain-containing protein [Amycolatopsis sp. NPDC051758]|uniref:NUMOD4 domain-containing protein n=1 Tax=Amycolatopsis sp. NPDC051758 TaxID=3363935 RepID=UPI003797E398
MGLPEVHEEQILPTPAITRDVMLLWNLHISGRVRLKNRADTDRTWEYLGHHYPNGTRTEAWLPVNEMAADSYSRILEAGKIVVDADGSAHLAAGGLDGPLDERWASVRGFEGLYDVSTMGRVRCYHADPRGRLVKAQVGGDGYHVLRLIRAGDTRPGVQARVHHLVLEAFSTSQAYPTKRRDVLHLNDNRRDDRLVNLEWAERKRTRPHTATEGGTCPEGHELTEGNVYRDRPGCGPKCRKCRRERQRAKRQAVRDGLI